MLLCERWPRVALERSKFRPRQVKNINLRHQMSSTASPSILLLSLLPFSRFRRNSLIISRADGGDSNPRAVKACETSCLCLYCSYLQSKHHFCALWGLKIRVSAGTSGRRVRARGLQWQLVSSDLSAYFVSLPSWAPWMSFEKHEGFDRFAPDEKSVRVRRGSRKPLPGSAHHTDVGKPNETAPAHAEARSLV